MLLVGRLTIMALAFGPAARSLAEVAETAPAAPDPSEAATPDAPAADASPNRQKSPRLTSREVRANRSGNLSAIPLAIIIVPSTAPLAAAGIRSDFYLTDLIVMGGMATIATGKYQEVYTRVITAEGQVKFHLLNSFYFMGGLGVRYFDRSGIEGNVILGRFNRQETYHFDTWQLATTGGVGNHWSWNHFSLGVQWFALTIPSRGFRRRDLTESNSKITAEQRADREREFKGDAAEVELDFVTTSVGWTF
jgi:hypothetical protein